MSQCDLDSIVDLLKQKPTKQEVMQIMALLLVEQIRLLRENAANREKALKQWHANPSNS